MNKFDTNRKTVFDGFCSNANPSDRDGGNLCTPFHLDMNDRKAPFNKLLVAFVVLFMYAMASTFMATAQSTTVCTADTVVGAFGVDGDLYANSPSSLNPLGIHDDWFEDATFPGPGIGVIGTTAATSVPVGLSAAQFRAIISNPASDRNRTYQQRMYAPALTPRFTGPGVGYLLLDAVAARDNHTAGSAKDSSAFTAGSDKNGANPNTWMIGTGGVQQKNDLIDAGGHIRREYDFANNVSGDLWGFAFATTRNTSGDAHTDFEIFRTAPVIVGNSLTQTGPDGGHTAGKFDATGFVVAPGDVLVAVDYANGGTNPQASVRIWIDPNNVDGAGMDTATLNTLPNRPFEFTGVFDGGTGSGTYGYAEIRPLTGSTADCLFWSVTNNSQKLGTPWGSLTSQNAAFANDMDPLQCVSVAINFSAFGLDIDPPTGPCFNLFGSLMVKTRSSGSFTSEMKDFMGPFVFGNFQEVNGEITGGGNLSCQTTAVKLYANTTTPGATFTWSVQAGTGGNIVTNWNDSILVDAAGCYILNVANPSLATCTASDTLCVMGTPDTDPPVCNAPGGATYACIEDVPACPTTYAEFLAQGGTASDPSGIDISSYSVVCGPLVGGECGGTITRTFSISDNCGNTSVSCIQVIRVNDIVPPIITNCPPGGDLGCNPNPSEYAADTSIFQATDNCMKLIKTWSDNLVTTGCLNTLTRTYTATDSCGNSTPCDQVFTWKVDLDKPVTQNCNTGSDLGCNPSATEWAPVPPTFTDVCGAVTPGQATGTPVITGCNGSVTHKFWATDLCLNVSDTCFQTFTWKVDLDKPVTQNCNTGSDLGCNPSATEWAPVPPTFTDVCGAVTPGQATGTPVITGCNGSVTHKFWATDLCLNVSDTCFQTFTWKVDLDKPVTQNCNTGSDLGCNPSATEWAPVPPTFTDVCGAVTPGQATGTPVITGCNGSVTHKFWATDLCLNVSDTCFQTFTWKVDLDKPVTQNCNTGSDLGCNPSATEWAPVPPTFTDVCGAVTPGQATGTPVITGCNGSVTHKFWATDLCLNVSDTCFQTFTWKVDLDKPVTQNCNTGSDLGCNPSATEWAPVPPTFTDVCGAVTPGQATGTPVITGCNGSVTHKFWATDLCLNVSDTCFQTFTWKVDLDKPVTQNCNTGSDLGCNPSATEWAPVPPTFTDVCGAVTPGQATGTPVITGCNGSVTHKFWATDLCLNVSDTCFQTFTWKVDLDKPVTQNCNTGSDLGCNPSATEWAPVPPTFTDVCGAVTPGQATGTPVITGCNGSVTHKFWATDLCLNVSDTCFQTFTWKVDLDKPVTQNCNTGSDLGCNPSATEWAPVPPTFTDVCGAVTPGQATGTPVITGCNGSVTHKFWATDLCLNVSDTCFQTFTWKVDLDKPVTQNCNTGSDLGCNPSATEWAPVPPTFTDVCGAVTPGQATGTPVITGCNGSVTHKFWATDLCLNVSDTCFQTFTWKVDLDKPVTQNCNTGSDLGCNPSATEWAPVPPTFTDVCGAVTPGQATGTPVITGCNGSVTHKFWATDLCLNVSDTCFQTFTWKVDLDKPVTQNCNTGSDLGCNPSATEWAPVPPTFTDVCGAVTPGQATGTPVITGCNGSVTHKFWATDLCLNVSDTCFQTFTWKVDLDKPVTQNCNTGSDLGCNPSATEWAPVPPTFTDVCGAVTPGQATGTPVITGCNGSVTHKFWATDLCLNVSDTCFQTFTWKVDLDKPVTQNCNTGSDLGCNPSATEWAPVPPTFTDVCGAVTPGQATGTPVITGCNGSVTHKFWATDLCLNVSDTCFQTFTWKVDLDKPVTQNCNTGSDLGCNPSATEWAPVPPTFTDVCGAVTPGQATGTPVITGCNGSVTHKFWATDLCLNVSDTCFQTFTWKVDLDKPVTQNCNTGSDLGCNPSATEWAPVPPTFTDVCGAVTPGQATGTPVITGCNGSVTHKFWATDLCLNVSDTCFQTFTWKVDLDKPVTQNCNTGSDLGCNPSATEWAPVPPTFTDVCGAVTPGQATGTPVITGCNGSVTHKFWATDLCLNVSDTCFQTFTWKVDLDKPVTQNCNTGSDLGCNPSATEWAPVPPTFTDVCGAVTPGQATGTPVITGCNGSVTHKFWATDLCLNVSDTCFQTFTWKVDLDKPVTQNCNTGSDLGCNPSATEWAPVPPTFTDVCGAVTPGQATGTPVITGCNGSVTHKFWATDLCLNVSDTCFQTFTWKVDLVKPVVNCGPDITVCDGDKVVLNISTANDNCDGPLTPTCTRSDGKALTDPFPVGVTTITCSATDGCNNTGTCSYDVTVIKVPTCTIVAPIDLPICNTPGNTISATVNNTDLSTTYQWTIISNDPLGVPWTITGGQGTPTLTYTAGSGTATFQLTVTNSANGVDCPSTCDLMLACLNDRFCTYTQGFYGNKGGKACNGEDTDQFLIGLLSGNPLVLGGNGNTLTLTDADVINGCFFSRLPGGGWSKPLNGAATCSNPVGIALKKGTFRNTLLNQTITLGLNLRIQGSNLDNLALNGMYLTTFASTGSSCGSNGLPIAGTGQVWKLPGLVLTYLGANNTVGDLYALANQALAGTYVPGNGQPSLGAIATACDIINNAFDECRMLGGFSNTAPTRAQVREVTALPNYEGITMNAYPNPFNEKASIEFKLDGFDSDVTIEVFTLTGERVASLYNGYASADETYKVSFDGSSLPPGIYMYQLNTGDRVYQDKLVLIK